MLLKCSIDFLFQFLLLVLLVQFSSALVSIHLENPICAPSQLSEVSPVLPPLKQFQCLSDWWWPSLVLSRKIVSHFLCPCLSPPGHQSCDVLGFVPAGRVSSSSILKIFWVTNHLWGLLCPPTSLLSRFLSLWHVQSFCDVLWNWLHTAVTSVWHSPPPSYQAWNLLAHIPQGAMSQRPWETIRPAVTFESIF